MADAVHPDRAAVDQTPDPDEIDRTPASERASKMPSMPGTTMDPKKMIGFWPPPARKFGKDCLVRSISG